MKLAYEKLVCHTVMAAKFYKVLYEKLLICHTIMAFESYEIFDDLKYSSYHYVNEFAILQVLYMKVF